MTFIHADGDRIEISRNSPTPDDLFIEIRQADGELAYSAVDANYLRAAIDAEFPPAEQSPRPLTADDIEELVNKNRFRVADAIRALYPEGPMSTDLLAQTVMAALTEPPAVDPEVQAIADVLGAFAVADEHTGERDDILLARHLHDRGVRVTGKDN